MKTQTRLLLALVLLVSPVLIGAAPRHEYPSTSPSPTMDSLQPLVPDADPVPMNLAEPTDNDGAHPEPADAGSYSINWNSVNGGGATQVGSSSYSIGLSVGQSVAGAATSSDYLLGIGFWYGTGGGGDCACNCHADPVCDGVRCNVQDVVTVVNVAFRGAAAIPDPNPLCPYQTTDTNCDQVTSVVDVVKIVNVAFRGGNPGTEFCDPCP